MPAVPFPDAEFTVASARDRDVARLISDLATELRARESREEIDEALEWLASEFRGAARGCVERITFCFGEDASMESYPRRFSRD